MTNRPLKWDDFEPVREDDVQAEDTLTDDINKALARIGSTPDGDHLKRFLLRSMTRACAPGASPVRLSEAEGERRFARLLFNRLNGTGHGGRSRKRGNRSGSNGGNAE